MFNAYANQRSELRGLGILSTEQICFKIVFCVSVTFCTDGEESKPYTTILLVFTVKKTVPIWTRGKSYLTQTLISEENETHTRIDIPKYFHQLKKNNLNVYLFLLDMFKLGFIRVPISLLANSFLMHGIGKRL